MKSTGCAGGHPALHGRHLRRLAASWRSHPWRRRTQGRHCEVRLRTVCIAIPCSELLPLKTLNDQVWRPASSLCLVPGCAWTCPSLPPKVQLPNIPGSGSRWNVTFPFCPAGPLHKASSSPPGPFASQFHNHTAYGAKKQNNGKITSTRRQR